MQRVFILVDRVLPPEWNATVSPRGSAAPGSLLWPAIWFAVFYIANLIDVNRADRRRTRQPPPLASAR
jgi:hypothetical protein